MNIKKKTILVLIPILIFAISFAAVFAIIKISKNPDSSSTEESKNPDASTEISFEASAQNDNDKPDKKPSEPEKSSSSTEEQINSEAAEESDSLESEITDSSAAESSEETSSENSAQESSELSEIEGSEASETSETSLTEESSQVIESEHDSNLLSSLKSAGYTIDDLKNKNCQQIITVDSSGSTAVIRYYSLNDKNVWEIDNSLTTNGYVGRNGVAKDNYEGSKKTPFGLYEVGEAFYIDSKPQTSLDIFQITNDTYWVDDPNSESYNKRVEGTSQKDWNSAEHMIEYNTSYHYGFVIEYNTKDTVPGAGSAFFFHVSYQPTAGCVGLSEPMVLNYLSKLDKKLNPFILMQ